MDLGCPVCFRVKIGSTCQSVLKDFFLVKENSKYSQGTFSVGTVRGTAESVAWAPGISLVSILHMGDRARVSTSACHYFSPRIPTRERNQHLVQHTAQGHSEYSICL